MFEITRYSEEKKNEWNTFVNESKNGTFLFDRNYMDYHSDRFHDHSLLFYLNGQLRAVIPANQRDDMFQTHAGLTYGGLVGSVALSSVETVELFRELNTYLKEQGIKRVVYKCIPSIYHRVSAEEDLYALYHVCHAKIVARDLSTNISLPCTIRWERVRRRGVKRAIEAGLQVVQSNSYADFWLVLTNNLGNKYGIKPVHTLAEIELLHSRFPQNIVLYEARKEGEVIAGIVMYYTKQVAHAQYSSATPLGKKLGAIDFLYDHILNNCCEGFRFFDFGRSTENADGSMLNTHLTFQKEGYGGRSVCYDVYEWEP